ncbi:MAG: hypothetical protein AAFX85_09015, partial [Pseudomonadota bacterium]
MNAPSFRALLLVAVLIAGLLLAVLWPRSPTPPSAPAPEPVVIDTGIDPEDARLMAEAAAQEAREEAYAQGYADGQAAQKEEISSQVAGDVQAVQVSLAELREREDALFDEVESRMTRLMLGVVHHLAKGLSEREAIRLAETVAMRAVHAVRGKHKVSIRATGEFLAHLREALQLPTDELAAEHRIVFEERTPEKEALEVAWLTGKVTFDPYAFMQAIDDVFT